MEWARTSKQNTLFVKIDFEKTYNNIEWNFILDILQALGFGPVFLRSIKIFFSNASTFITLDDMDKIGLFRSLKQDCPLAPSLYVLVLEAFGYRLASKASQGLVRGIPLPRNQGQLINVHFVDDSFLTLRGDQASVQQAFQCLVIFVKPQGPPFSGGKPLAIDKL